MPRSKRNKVVTLSKTQKRPGRENNEKLFGSIRNCIDNYQYCFVFSVDNMRNTYLKNVRSEWSDSRLFFGKTKVMAKSLGLSPEDEYRDGLSKLTEYVAGNVGLFFTSRPPTEVLEYFEAFIKTDYARSGCIATDTFTVPAGVVYSRGGEIPIQDDVPMAHSLEPTVRALGMPTKLVNGKVYLDQEYVVCKKGEVLNSQQTRLLKQFGSAMAEFQIKLIAYWSAADGSVKAIKHDE